MLIIILAPFWAYVNNDVKKTHLQNSPSACLLRQGTVCLLWGWG
jgi:hypothetical protein